MQVEVKLTGIDGVLATLESLPAEVVSRRGGPVKSALRKGALLILKAEQVNLRTVMGHKVDEREVAATGLLLKNLIVSRGKAPTSGKGERYLVRVKNAIYPGRRGSRPVTTRLTAQRLEYGGRGGAQPAESFIRTAFLANAALAISTIERELVAGVNRVVKKLAIQNRGK